MRLRGFLFFFLIPFFCVEAKTCEDLIARLKERSSELSELVVGHRTDAVNAWFKSLEDPDFKVPEGMPTIKWIEGQLKARISRLEKMAKTKNLEDFALARISSDLETLKKEMGIFRTQRDSKLSYSRYKEIVGKSFDWFDLGLYEPSPDGILKPITELPIRDSSTFEGLDISYPAALGWALPQDQITFENFNGLAPYPIYIHGLTADVMTADGSHYRPSGFGIHDRNHNLNLHRNVSEHLLAPRKRLTIVINRLELEIARQEWLRRLDPEVREAAEALHFLIWHERGLRPNRRNLLHSFDRAPVDQLVDELWKRSRPSDMGSRSKESIQRAVSTYQDFLR